MISISQVEHPEKAVDMAEAMRKSLTDSPFVKDAKHEDDVLTYKGFKFNRVTVTMDIDKLLEQQGQGNPAAQQIARAMLGGESVTTYAGSDGKLLLSVMAKTEEELKSKVDTLLEGTAGIGKEASYEVVRSRLPREVSGMFMMNMQALTKQIASMFSAMTNAELEVPADMPKEPALLGGSLSATPAGYRFDFVVPSSVGPVIEKGMVPMFQSLQGQVNQ
jgi:hypothetical protein